MKSIQDRVDEVAELLAQADAGLKPHHYYEFLHEVWALVKQAEASCWRQHGKLIMERSSGGATQI